MTTLQTTRVATLRQAVETERYWRRTAERSGDAQTWSVYGCAARDVETAVTMCRACGVSVTDHGVLL